MMPLLLLYPFYTYGQWEDGKALEVPIVTHLKGSVLPGIKYCRRLLSTGKDVEGRVHQGPLHRTIMSRRYNSLGWGRVSGPDYSCGTGLSLGKDPFFSTLHSSPCSILSFSWSNKKSYMRPFQSHPFSYLRSTLNSRCWKITIFYHHDQGSPSPPTPCTCPVSELGPPAGSAASRSIGHAGMQVGSPLTVLLPPPSAPSPSLSPADSTSWMPLRSLHWSSLRAPAGRLLWTTVGRPWCAAGRRSSPRRKCSAFLMHTHCHDRPCWHVSPARSRRVLMTLNVLISPKWCEIVVQLSNHL